MKSKSDEYFETAIFLIENDKLSPSVHCYYYSGLQLSKHILKEKHQIDYEMQDKESKTSESGSHNYVINTLFNKLSKKNRFQGLDYQKNINALKRLRVKADYSDSDIDVKETEFAQKYISEIRRIIALRFNLEL